MITVRAICHDELEDRLDDLAALRIAVFREWPYLYDGDHAYEREYLQTYKDAAQSVVIGAFEGDWMVGAATGAPLHAHADGFAAAFQHTDVDVRATFYCAESVLLQSYRGRGIGHKFFDRREAHAQDCGFQNICFCAVERADDHPERPAKHRSLEPFWTARGYNPVQGVKARFAWRDVGDVGQSEKQLQFWMRTL